MHFDKAFAPFSECRRCGTCCRKGGPALHRADRDSIESGRIPLKDLFTIRRGEPACDNVRGRVAPAADDIIKIRPAAGHDSACIYLDREQAVCRIYALRPLECRLLTCWDTAAITAAYDKERLTRGELLTSVPHLRDLMAEHQHRCDYAAVGRWAGMLRGGGPAPEAAARLSELVLYDQSLREVAVERAGLHPELLDFLFGRPLSITLRMFDLQIPPAQRHLV